MKKAMQKFLVFLTAIFVFSLITACSSSVADGEEVKTYSVRINYSDSEIVTLSVEEGEALSSLAEFVLPSKEGFNFGGFKISGGGSFGVNDPVLSDLVLYVKFYKTEVDEDTGASTKIEECSDGTSSFTTKTTDDDGTVTTTTESTDAQGNTTTVEVVETQNDDGSVTITTTTTDPNGNTTTQTEISEDTAQYWVNRGLAVLREQYEDYADLDTLATAIKEAKGYFEKAYQTDPTNDEAKIYSALCNLSDIATNSKIKNFARNHLGITNYPSSLEDLIKGDWLTEGEYQEEEHGYMNGVIMEEVPKPYLYNYATYYFRATPDENGSISSDSYCYMVTKCPDAPEGFFAERYAEYEYRKNHGEYMEYPEYFSNRKFRLDDNGEYLIYKYFNPYDDYSEEFQNHTAYKNDYNYYDFRYTYYRDIKAPKFNRNFKNNWISAGVDSGIEFWQLILANALEGNTNGLNSAIDDLYDALFGSEYQSAYSKIDAINSPVTIPAWVMESFGLDEVFGSSNVKLGKTELKLVESVLDIFKFLFEYLQSYNLDSDLSVLKVDWNTVFSGQSSTISFFQDNLGSYNAAIDPIAQGFLNVRSRQKMADSKQTLLSILDDVITAYSEITGRNSIYPQAFKDFLVGEDGLGDLLYEGAQKLRTALINGTKFYIPMEDFIDGRVPASWPVSGDDWVDLGKAFTPGLFSAENCIELNQQRKPVFYKVHSWEEYKYDEEYGYNRYSGYQEEILGTITGAQDFKDYMETIQEAKDQKDALYSDPNYHYNDYTINRYYITTSFKPLHRTMSSVSSLWNNYVIDDEDQMATWCTWDEPVAAIIYNFYYGGLDDLISEFSE